VSGAPEVPLKESFVDGDVLDGHQAVTRLMLDDGVDEHGRIAIAQAIELWGMLMDNRASLPNPSHAPGRRIRPRVNPASKKEGCQWLAKRP
jgi:hypothetical protein